MQLTPTVEQWEIIDKVSKYILFPALGWFFKTVVHKLQESLHEIVTDNTNRVRDELAKALDIKFKNQESLTNSYIDHKFQEHEDNAFGRITALERSVQELIRLTNEMRKTV